MSHRFAVSLVFSLCLPAALHAAGSGKGDGLSQKEIVTVIQEHNDDARDCYQKALEKDKDAEGRVKIRFLIGLKGKVEATEAEQNTFKDKTVFNCLKTKMNAWVFPKPRGGERVSIAYPFEFKTVAAPKTSEAAPKAAEAAPASSPSEAVPAAAPSQQAPEKTSKTQD